MTIIVLSWIKSPLPLSPLSFHRGPLILDSISMREHGRKREEARVSSRRCIQHSLAHSPSPSSQSRVQFAAFDAENVI